jgi:hypothetical protein
MQELSLFQPDDQAELGELRKSLPPPMASPPPPKGSERPRRTKRGRFSDLLEPLDEQAKALKPNCDECRGCNFELRDIRSSEIQFQNIHFQHGAGNSHLQPLLSLTTDRLTTSCTPGATSNWMFFASRPGEDRRSTVKVFCIPLDKRASLRRGWDDRSRSLPINECSSKTASDRLQLLLIQERLTEECGVQEIFPRMWVSKLSAVIPGEKV